MDKFKTAHKDKTIVIVEGERLTIGGINCFVFKEQYGFNISHLETGMKMTDNKPTIHKALMVVKRNMKKHPDWLESGIKTLEKHGFKYPLNDPKK